MPQLAVGVVAAAVAAGAAEAGLLGVGVSVLSAASAAFSIGSLIGGILFAPPGQHTDVQGSRLGDLSVTSSTYGSQIPIGFGTIRLAGNIIWAIPIKEVKSTVSTGGGGKGALLGKGGPTQTTTNFTYFGNFAIALAKGPADKVMKIWLDSNLVYDITAGVGTGPVSTDPLVADPGTDGFGPLSTGFAQQKPGLNFRFYPGSETQLPDSLIEADKGVGNVPAFRGTCYLVFEDLALAAYGNRLPNVSVELAFSTVPLQTTVPLFGGPVPHPTGLPTRIGITVNPLTLRGYLVAAPGGTTGGGVVEFDLLTMEVIGEHPMGTIMGDPVYNGFNPTDGDIAVLIGFDQMLYIAGGDHMYVINPNSWTGTVRHVTLDLMSPNNLFGVACVIGMIGPNGVENYIVIGGENLPFIRVIDIGDLPSTGTTVRAMTPGQFGAAFGHAYVLEVTGNGTGAVVYIDEVSISVHASGGVIPSAVRGATIRLLSTIQATDIDAAADGFDVSRPLIIGGDPSGLIYDATDNGLLFQVTPTYSGVAGAPYLVKVDIASGQIVWATRIASGALGLAGGGAAYSNITDGRYAKMYGDHVVAIDTTNGAILSDVNWPDLASHGISATGQQIFDDISNVIIVNLNDVWTKIPVDRASAGSSTLEDVFTAICELAGMPAPDFDAAALATIPVPGYTVSQRAAAADIEKPLAQLFQVDAIESDWKIKFIPRGGAVLLDLPEASLIRPASANDQSSAEPYTETRTQEVDLPDRFTVTYADPAANFQTNTQQAKRVRAPIATVFSDQQQDLQLGIVISADTAAQYAERLLYAAWNERSSFTLQLPRDYLWLDPSDPVTLTLSNGLQIRGRLGPVDLGVDYSLSTAVVGESDGQYVSTATGQIPLGPPPQTIPVPLPSALFMLDIPLLRDTDDANGIGIRAYWAASAYNDVPWPGALLQGSPDSTTWTNLDTETDAAAWGHIEEALPDALASFHTHYEQSITVFMTHGGETLESVTLLQMSNGFNGAAVFKSNADVEVIQFRDVTALGGNRYRLSVLRRGRRGTDTMASDHVAGEQILMLRTANTRPLLLDQGVRDKIGFYRAITNGSIAQAAIIDSQVFHARDQMPWAPVHTRAVTAGSDIVLTAQRRTRVGGQAVNAAGPQPLGEASEAYEIDIYDAGATTVLRTLTSTTLTKTYTAAQITADFGSAPANLNLAWYQMSETVGRGFGRLDALAVA